jgi:Bifunctional DNA primase/polymerase, N-terminal
MTAESDVTLSQALAYASHGWPVFPCQPGGKEPATRHGFHDATTDPEQIERWWERQPAANLAIAAGLPGPDVLDVDERGEAGSGLAAYNRLRRAGLLEGVSVIVATPGGGLHAYFAGSEQASGRLPRHHLDFKSRGGYVLAPPSQVNGKPYRLMARQAESGTLDWPAVASILDPERRSLIRPAQSAPSDVSHLGAWVERLREGNRNSGLFWAACRAIEASQPGGLDDLAAAAARAGLDDREILRTIESARRASQRICQRQAEREGER